MAIVGIHATIGQSILTRAQWLSSRPQQSPVLPGHVEHFAQALNDKREHPIDPITCHIIDMVSHEMKTHEDQYELVSKALRKAKQSLLGSNDPSMPIVPIGGRSQPFQVEWSDRLNSRSMWWYLSDETKHPEHFRRSTPQDVVMFLGVFQGLNLANDSTRCLLRVDNDGRQHAADAIFGGLLLTSRDPRELIHHFLVLPFVSRIQDRVARAMERVDHEGEFGSMDRSRLFKALCQRTGHLSLLSVYSAFQPTLLKMREGRSLTERERASFNWLLDPAQFSTAVSLYQKGKSVSLQANVFDPEGMERVIHFLNEKELEISTLYLSNPQDMVGGGYEGPDVLHAFKSLQRVLRKLPFHGEAKILWTSIMGIPSTSVTDQGEVQILEESHHADGPYAYIEMPAALFIDWLSRPHLREPGQHLHELNQMIRDQGTWRDGKLTIHSASAFAK